MEFFPLLLKQALIPKWDRFTRVTVLSLPPFCSISAFLQTLSKIVLSNCNAERFLARVWPRGAAYNSLLNNISSAYAERHGIGDNITSGLTRIPELISAIEKMMELQESDSPLGSHSLCNHLRLFSSIFLVSCQHKTGTSRIYLFP